MTKEMNRTRYLTLVGTIITQFALGSVYTWSLFNAQLAAKLDEPVSQVAFVFGLLSLSLAVASSMAGKLQERFGVRNVTLGAGLLLGLGFLLTAQASNLMMLYLCAGILVGFADGTGYLMTLSNCVKWFPERKGLISALAIGAYGLGSLGFKYINVLLLENTGLETTFQLWGLIAMALVLCGGMLMKDAPAQSAASQQTESRDFTLAEAMRKPQYWMLALMFLSACMSGLYVIGVAKDIGEKMVDLPVLVAANAVAVIAMANLSGRLVLGILSDKIPRIRVISLAQIITLVGMVLLLFVPLNANLFFVAVACVAFSFGGTITVYPSLVSDFFGLNNLTKNYGVIYLGFGVGSIIGSIVASLFGGFIATFNVILVLLVVALVMSLTIRMPEPKTPVSAKKATKSTPRLVNMTAESA
ncbi:MFS transporter [Shewanella sp. SM95]|uniref:L-lactate MFS transporter n=1 Tax=Shewanella sp. SM95 TaxID=2912812 RepID=UPI0021DABF76|nr:MFS transporter [Shewanella sp. SM95]MCU8000428.1 MFS transporter [Shewanella sp. SM95]